jgi:two-component system LytT family response regulator
MKRIKTILVDDEARALTSLEKLLSVHCPVIEVMGSCRDADEAIEMIRQVQPDLVFLDISMPGKDGFELLQDLHGIPFEIIFVTAYNQYMLQAFQFSAVDYILKPVDYRLLVSAVDRAVQRIEQKSGIQHIETLLYNIRLKDNLRKRKLCIPSLKGFQVIESKDIIYCEANSNYTSIHLLDKPAILASKPLLEYENLLVDSGFIRVHKSFLVNLDQIKEYVKGEGGSLILSNGAEVEVSRRRKEELLQRMKEHYSF